MTTMHDNSENIQFLWIFAGTIGWIYTIVFTLIYV